MPEESEPFGTVTEVHPDGTVLVHIGPRYEYVRSWNQLIHGLRSPSVVRRIVSVHVTCGITLRTVLDCYTVEEARTLMLANPLYHFCANCFRNEEAKDILFPVLNLDPLPDPAGTLRGLRGK